MCASLTSLLLVATKYRIGIVLFMSLISVLSTGTGTKGTNIHRHCSPVSGALFFQVLLIYLQMASRTYMYGFVLELALCAI